MGLYYERKCWRSILRACSGCSTITIGAQFTGAGTIRITTRLWSAISASTSCKTSWARPPSPSSSLITTVPRTLCRSHPSSSCSVLCRSDRLSCYRRSSQEYLTRCRSNTPPISLLTWMGRLMRGKLSYWFPLWMKTKLWLKRSDFLIAAFN